MTLSWSRDYLVGASSDNSFVVRDVYGEGGWGHRTTQLYSQTVYFWLDGVNFVSYQSSDYSTIIHQTQIQVRFFVISEKEWSI